jgi:hypothetical protein
MKVQKLTRKQARELVEKTPIDVILCNENRRLTHKQREFARHLAVGETKADAYRKAYKGGKASVRKKADGNRGSDLAKHEGIKREVDAIKAGIEFQRLYSEAQLKALVVAQLTKEALNPDNQGSTRVNALKTLGTVAGVDAFIHRTETRVIKDSETLKAELMAKIKEALSDKDRTIDADAEALLNEISTRPVSNTGSQEATEGQPPKSELAEADILYSIPPK